MSELILYKKMYLELFHSITNVITKLDEARVGQEGQALDDAIEIVVLDLRKAQQKTEQIYIEN